MPTQDALRRNCAAATSARRSGRGIAWLAVIAAAMTAHPAFAADVAAGKKKVATVCAACHGLDGIAKNPDAPNLAGDNTGYIIKQLKAFKSGARQQDQMSIIAQELSEDDMANVAAWYSSLKISVTLPQ
ncbi:MAG TPA: cytochrome c [Dongiaceae bacterium]|nr:cytochrome c [Dongiaceae bacterium]